MNLIEAWKLAKVGQNIGRGLGWTLTKTDLFGTGNLTKFCDALVGDGNPSNRMFDIHALADDWEVVKEKKKLAFDFDQIEGMWIEGGWEALFKNVPKDAIITVEWEE